MKIRHCLFVLSFALLAACASSPSREQQDAKLAESTDQCLADPNLAKVWGECNVKSVIYQRSDGIAQCQSKFAQSQGGTLMLKIRLKPNGKVRRVWPENGTARNKNLEKCLSTEIAKLQFAAPPKGVDPVIYFPFQQ